MRNYIFLLLLLFAAPELLHCQIYKLGAFVAPGMAHRSFTVKEPDSTMLFTENDKPGMGSEAGLLLHWYPERRFHLEGSLQAGKKGFHSITYGENRFIDYTGIEIIGSPPDEVNSKVEFYFASLGVRAGYDIYQDRSFSAGARGGFLLDVYIFNSVRQKAYYPDRTEKIIIKPDFEDLQKINVSGSFSLFASYVLSDNWEVSLEPYGSLSLMNSLEGESYSLKFYNVGLRASILLLLDTGPNYKNPVF